MGMPLQSSLSPFTVDIGYAIRSDVHVLISGGDSDERRAIAIRIHGQSARHLGQFAVARADQLWELLATNVRTRSAVQPMTLFIEEAAALDAEAQLHLLRLLEWEAATGVDTAAPRTTRVIASTSNALATKLVFRQFRADLFYRLNAIHIMLETPATRPHRWLM